MLIETPKTKAWLIGDPHMGRSFVNGTPLHRRGEREKMQRAQFIDELNTPDVDIVVMVGDLFDKPFVPLTILSQVIGDVLDAAELRPDVEFVMMAGNHDLSRQLGTRAAWHIFDLAVRSHHNIAVINEPIETDGFFFAPWEWGVSALEQVEKHCSSSVHTAIGHWDLMSFGGDDSHMAPTEALRALNPDVEIYSGHYHEEGDFKVAGVDVHCTGSMQPYAHGEGEMYVTLTPEEAMARDDLYDKCVRILLAPGEQMPEIDCLNLTKKLVSDTEPDEIELNAVAAQTFNVQESLARALEEGEVPDQVVIFIKEELGALD